MFEINITVAGESVKRTISQDDLMKLLDLPTGKNVVGMSVTMKTDRGELSASFQDDPSYADVTVDGAIDGKTYWLAEAELPIPGDSECIVSRLYAGNSELETDCPIVLMPNGDRAEGDESKRIVFYDPDFVDVAPVGHYACEQMYQATTVNGQYSQRAEGLDGKEEIYSSDCPDTDCTERMLSLNTVHLKPETLQRLVNDEDPNVVSYPKVTTHDPNCGVFVFVLDDVVQYYDSPDDICRCLEFALDHGISLLNFDYDAPEIEGLPRYVKEWDEFESIPRLPDSTL